MLKLGVAVVHTLVVPVAMTKESNRTEISFASPEVLTETVLVASSTPTASP